MMNSMSYLETRKLNEESDSEFIARLCELKQELHLTWKNIAELVERDCGLIHSESWYRRNYQNGSFSEVVSHEAASFEEPTPVYKDTSEEEQKLDDKLRKLAMKKVEVSDLVTQNNAYIRRLSREQTIKDIAHDYATIMNKEKILSATNPLRINRNGSTQEGILLLSDWHYGMVCDNPWNTFDPDICRERVSKLLERVIQIVNREEIYHVTVLDLADLIAGRIHTQIRIESRFDVITQTMDVAEILAEFLNTLSGHCEVSFYSCLDNHSRLEPNKKESMDLESLARLIPWYLTQRLSSNRNVKICSNVFGPDIITCKVAGHDVIAVHGDHDSPVTGIDKLSLMTHQHYDLFCTAHRHHFQLEEKNHCVVVGNSSLMGTDSYAEKLRLSSDPSQTFILVTPNNVCECIYRIVLK